MGSSCVGFLCFFLIFISQTVRTRNEDLPCPLSITVLLERDKVQRYENGSIFHEGTLYPNNLYWTNNDSLRGCICELRPCLRKCCENGEVLSDGETPNCTKLQDHEDHVIPDLRVNNDHLTSEIQNIRSIVDHFVILPNRICENNKSYILHPEEYEEDEFMIEADGILRNGENIYPQWMYCIDWHQSLKKIIVSICFQHEEELPILTTQIYPIMTIISIPFLIITFFVYAIIPELRNIYGKTLMCYVVCLTISYCFLINSQLKYLPRDICIPVENTTNEGALIQRKNTREDYIRYCVPEGNCLSFCCPPDYYLVAQNKCERIKNESIPLPPVYSIDLTPMNVTTNEENFRFFYWDPCIETENRSPLNPNNYPDEKFYLLKNGSFYLPFSAQEKRILNPEKYCLAAIEHISTQEYLVIFCEEKIVKVDSVNSGLFFSIGMIVSVLFLLITWLVYTLIKELQNLHGVVLRAYILSLTVSFSILSAVRIVPQNWISQECCFFIAICMYFFFLASFYWLNVMCFDIWWTFGGFRALRGSLKQRDRKKFIMYSIYAWGMASLFTGICLIMDFAPNIPENFIRPQLGAERCWFKYNTATNIYFIGPMTLSVFCNLCLFISTALKIQQHNIDTANQLRSSESRRHDDNKQWFNLYLKLFIVMGITWSTEIISTLWKESSNYIWYISDAVNTLQGLIIFITLVCKKKIKRLLLKRFGYNGNKFLSRNFTRSVDHSTATRTTCTTSTDIPLQTKINANIRRETFGASKGSAEESDCP